MVEIDTTIDFLRRTSVASLATVLGRSGLKNVWMNGPRPLNRGQGRVAGPAFTVRFIPAREDVAATQPIMRLPSLRASIDTMPAGCIVVADAMGIAGAGAFGDIGCARMQYRKVAGLITDGAVRDYAGLTALGWPVWASATAAPPSLSRFYCADTQVAVACGGVTIFPGDIVVADDDGAIVIPAAMVAHVARSGFDKDRLEEWILERVKEGEPLEGLYPPNDATKKRFEDEKSIDR